MFVKTTVRRRGDKAYTYLSLVEAVRVGGKNTHNTLLRLGEVSELRESGQLDRIIAALSTHAEGSWVASSSLEAAGAPSLGGVAAVGTYFSRLGLDELFASLGAARGSRHLEDTVLVLLANRLLRPVSKRRTILEWLSDVALPAGVAPPSLAQCYRALDVLSAEKDAVESHLYRRLTDLANLDLRLCCYDLTSTYFESTTHDSPAFPSRAFGYSRDHRGDRPQVMIGLLVTGDGIPLAHHVFPGNTKDSATLPGVMADLQYRFGVGKIALVADRGLITEANLDAVSEAGFDHVLATRLHRDADVAAVLESAQRDDVTWVPVEEGRSSACEIAHGGRRYVVVDSPPRRRRDNHRREELLSRAEDGLIALEARVRAGKLVDPAKIGAAADRILRDSGVTRLFTTTIRPGRFSWAFDDEALDYEEHALAGRYVITTSLSPAEASTAQVVRHYRSLMNVERRFRVLKDFLSLRPVHHFTEERVRGHVALCVIAAVIEAVMGNDLARRAGQRSGPSRADDDPAARHRRTRPDPPSPHRGRRARDRTRHPAQRPPGQGAEGPRCRHLELGQGHDRLSWADVRPVVETRPTRAPSHLQLRKGVVKLGSDSGRTASRSVTPEAAGALGSSHS